MLTKCGKIFENKLDEYSELIDKLSDLKFELEISHLVDVFEQLNITLIRNYGNETLEGSANVFIFVGKIRAFVCKFNLWINKIGNENRSTNSKK